MAHRYPVFSGQTLAPRGLVGIRVPPSFTMPDAQIKSLVGKTLTACFIEPCSLRELTGLQLGSSTVLSWRTRSLAKWKRAVVSANSQEDITTKVAAVHGTVDQTMQLAGPTVAFVHFAYPSRAFDKKDHRKLLEKLRNYERKILPLTEEAAENIARKFLPPDPKVPSGLIELPLNWPNNVAPR